MSADGVSPTARDAGWAIAAPTADPAPDVAVLERMLELARRYDVRGMRGAGWEFELNPKLHEAPEHEMSPEERREQVRKDLFAAGAEVPDLRAQRAMERG